MQLCSFIIAHGKVSVQLRFGHSIVCKPVWRTLNEKEGSSVKSRSLRQSFSVFRTWYFELHHLWGSSAAVSSSPAGRHCQCASGEVINGSRLLCPEMSVGWSWELWSCIRVHPCVVPQGSSPVLPGLTYWASIGDIKDFIIALGFQVFKKKTKQLPNFLIGVCANNWHAPSLCFSVFRELDITFFSLLRDTKAQWTCII